MLLLRCNDLKKSFGYTEVLKKVDLELKEGEVVGLVGANGAGKSTLANLIFGKLQPDQGIITHFQANLKVGYLLQSKEYLVNEYYEFGAGSGMQLSEYYVTTSNLGLDKVQSWEKERFQGLSGGERTKLALAEVWANRPDLLILDEPTNHLDFVGIHWIVEELSHFPGTVFIISHDRYFLDQVAERIVEIEDGVIEEFAGNYTFYRQEKQRRFESQLHQYQVQQKKQRKIEEEMKRVQQWSAKAHREAGKVGKMAEMRKGIREFYRAKAKKMDTAVKSRMKRLERMKEDGIEKPKEEPYLYFSLDNLPKHGRRILEARGISKGFGERILFQDSSFFIQRGEKVGLFGLNGCGKTTLIQMILGAEVVDQGEIWVSPSAKIGYLSQEVGDLDSEETVLEALGLSGRTYIATARQTLAGLGFDEAMIQRKIGQLSMGEQIRVKLAILILDNADLLILDEPTNHLDLYSREELEEALLGYQGTILVVSHDRYLLEKLTDRLLIFKDQQVWKFEGSLNEYEKKEAKQGENEKEKLREELMVVENRLTILLSQFGSYSPEDSEYLELDQEFQKLVKEKRRLIKLLG